MVSAAFVILLTVAAVVAAGRLVLTGSSDDNAISSSSMTTANEEGNQEPGPAAAETIVRRFVDGIRADELAAAVELWSGYPNMMSESTEVRVRAVDRMSQDHEWIRSSAALMVSATPHESSPMVYVVTVAGGGHAAAFVVGEGFDGSRSSGELQIHRLPSESPTMDPPPGTPVRPGTTITIADLPVEGGATVSVDGTAVEVTVEHSARRILFDVPAVNDDAIVAVVSVATPELPAAYAAWFPIAG